MSIHPGSRKSADVWTLETGQGDAHQLQNKGSLRLLASKIQSGEEGDSYRYKDGYLTTVGWRRNEASLPRFPLQTSGERARIVLAV